MTVERNPLYAFAITGFSAVIGSTFASFIYVLCVSWRNIPEDHYLVGLFFAATQLALISVILTGPLILLVAVPVVYFHGDRFIQQPVVDFFIVSLIGGLLGFVIQGLFFDGSFMRGACPLFGSLIAGLHVPIACLVLRGKSRARQDR